MTRHQLFGIALGTALCLALAGPAVAAFEPSPKAPLKIGPPHLNLTSLSLHTSSGGLVAQATTSVFQVSTMKKGTSYELRIGVKNTGSNSLAKTIQVHVVGCDYNSVTRSYNYDKKFDVSIPALQHNWTSIAKMPFIPECDSVWHQFAVLGL